MVSLGAELRKLGFDGMEVHKLMVAFHRDNCVKRAKKQQTTTIPDFISMVKKELEHGGKEEQRTACGPDCQGCNHSPA